MNQEYTTRGTYSFMHKESFLQQWFRKSQGRKNQIKRSFRISWKKPQKSIMLTLNKKHKETFCA